MGGVCSAAMLTRRASLLSSRVFGLVLSACAASPRDGNEPAAPGPSAGTDDDHHHRDGPGLLRAAPAAFALGPVDAPTAAFPLIGVDLAFSFAHDSPWGGFDHEAGDGFRLGQTRVRCKAPACVAVGELAVEGGRTVAGTNLGEPRVAMRGPDTLWVATAAFADDQPSLGDWAQKAPLREGVLWLFGIDATGKVADVVEIARAPDHTYLTWDLVSDAAGNAYVAARDDSAAGSSTFVAMIDAGGQIRWTTAIEGATAAQAAVGGGYLWVIAWCPEGPAPTLCADPSASGPVTHVLVRVDPTGETRRVRTWTRADAHTHVWSDVDGVVLTTSRRADDDDGEMSVSHLDADGQPRGEPTVLGRGEIRSLARGKDGAVVVAGLVAGALAGAPPPSTRSPDGFVVVIDRKGDIAFRDRRTSTSGRDERNTCWHVFADAQGIHALCDIGLSTEEADAWDAHEEFTNVSYRYPWRK